MSEEKLQGWNHMSKVPLKCSPLFTWPINPIEVIKWIWNSWFLLSERLILVGIAFISLLWFQPSLETTQSLHYSWILEIYIKNFILIAAVAGGLHLYFYTFTKQGQKLRFDARPLMKNGRQFTLNGQIKDNMFWTLTSGVFFWTFYECLMFWAMSNGFAPKITWAENPIWFIALFALIPVWESFYFYWMHRLLHVPFLYKHVHTLHHRNINIGPWSGLSMHPVEHILFLGSVVIHFIVPANPVHILYHLQYYALTAATTHTGFEGILMNDKNRMKLGTFHHQMHHRYFECNYGSLEIPWDKFFGSFHDGTLEADAHIKERRKKMMGG